MLGVCDQGISAAVTNFLLRLAGKDSSWTLNWGLLWPLTLESYKKREGGGKKESRLERNPKIPASLSSFTAKY